jgi:hypothetical protein
MRETFTSGSTRGEWAASIGLALSPTLPAFVLSQHPQGTITNLRAAEYGKLRPIRRYPLSGLPVPPPLPKPALAYLICHR